MTTGTKVFLALFALIVGVLVVYYGVVMPDRADATRDGEKVAAGAGDAGTSDARQDVGPTDPSQLAQNQSQSPPERSAPPPRDPAPTAPPTNQGAPKDATAARGLLSDGVNEANGGPESGGGVTPISPDANASQNPAAAFLPLVGLNNGNLKSGDGSAEPKDDVGPVATPNDSAGPTTQPADPPATAKPEDGPAAAAPPPAATRIEYIIEEDDTFVSIAEKWFGDENKWSLIAKENPTVDPQKLKIGQKIFLPPKEAGVVPVEREPVLADGQMLYVVKSGDTLIAIARDELSDQTRWEEIYALNKDKIGADAAALKVGMKLILPKAK